MGDAGPLFGGKTCRRCAHYRKLELPEFHRYDAEEGSVFLTGRCAVQGLKWEEDGADYCTCGHWTLRARTAAGPAQAAEG